MDSRTTKRLLKEASDAIKAKNFFQADDLTSRILMFDGRNYNALVFRGLCREDAQKSEEALDCYRSAVEVKRDGPLAWQALVSFYEKRKKEEDSPQLLEAYGKLLQLTDGSNPKRPDLVVSYVELLLKEQQTEQAAVLAEKEVDGLSSELLKFRVHRLLLDAYKRLGATEKLMSLQEHLILNASHLFLNEPQALNETICSFIMSLRKAGCQPELLRKRCSDVLLVQPGHALAQETVFLLQLEEVLMSPDIETKAPCLVKVAALPEDHTLGALLHGIETWMEGHPESALDALEQDVEPLRLDRWRVTSLLRCRMAAAMHCVATCREALAKATAQQQSESIHSPDRLAQSCRYFFWRCCVSAGDDSQVALLVRQELHKDQLEDVMQLGPEWKILIASMLIMTKKLSEAEAILKGIAPPETHILLEELRLCQSTLSLARDQFDEVLENLKDEHQTALALILKGKALWALGQHSDANAAFELAVERDPFSWEAFLFIGKYCVEQNQSSAAREAFKRSFQLNRNSENGEVWCDFLFKRRNFKEALKMLEKVTKERNNIKWAWFRKGNVHWAMKNPSEAVYAFQNAITCDRSDPIAHECLGDCNSALGSNETAVKNYKEALKIDRSREYSQIRIAQLMHKLGKFQSAVEEYLIALDMASPSNQVQVLKGLGDTYVALATWALGERLVKLAITHTEKAVHYLTKAFTLKPHFVSVARSLADACLILNVVPDLELQLHVPCTLMTGSFIEAFKEEPKVVDREGMLRLATRLYATCLQLKKDCADTWCCLGFAMMQLSSVTRDLSLLDKAESCVRHALSLNKEVGSYWNLLGIIYSMEKKTTFQAQHCFLQAIMIDEQDAVAWSNLGFLYVLHGKAKFAHDVFLRSQSTDDKCVLAWLGQGRVAQASEDTKEAFDFFRHSLVLGHTEYGALSYARLVLLFDHNTSERKSDWFRSNILLLSALANASEALDHSLEMDPRCKLALHCQALLSARLGYDRKARSAIEKCLQLSSEPDSRLHLNALRILEFGAAPEIDRTLALPEEEQTSAQALCLRAYLLAKRGDLEAAITHYEQAIELTDEMIEKSQMAAAIGFHAYPDDTELASDWLIRAGNDEVRSDHATLGLAALGVLTKEEEIADCVLSELMEMKDDPHAAYLLSLVLRLTDSYTAGLRALQQSLHLRPADARLWHYLTRYLLESSGGEEENAAYLSANAAEIALSLSPAQPAHARLMGAVFARFGDCLPRRLERRQCALFRLYPTDPQARANVAAVARRESDHAGRGAVRVLRGFATAMRDLASS